MYAYEIPGLRFSMPAGGAVARHRFVAITADKAVQATTSTPVIGVSMNMVTAEELEKGDRVVEIADGIVMVEAGGAVTAGATVSSNADGKAIAATEKVVGTAITSATTAGQLIAVKL